MHHPPTVKGIQSLVVKINHARQVKQRSSQQTKVEHDGGGGEALTLPDRETDVREEGEYVHNDEII